MGKRITLWLAGLSACLCSQSAFAGSPELHVVQPAGLQRGTVAALTLRGVRLSGAREILFYEPGITVSTVTNTDDATVTAECAIAADCPLGEHHLRLRADSGITDLRTVWIGALPIVNEVEPNSDFAAPQKVPMNSTIAGVVTSEDIDFYVVEVKKGERISAEIEAMRLGRTMFDPAIAILNAERFELAVSDDSSLLLQDSVASIVAPSDGVYTVSVREASFGGNDQSAYLLHIGNFPRPTVAYPPGGTTGQSATVALIGDPAGPIVLNDLMFPVDAGESFPILAEDASGMAPSPVMLRLAAMPSVFESNPFLSDVATKAPSPANATITPTTQPAPAPVAPVAFYGIIAKAGEVDRWRFMGRKGVRADLTAYARRLRSPLDAVLTVFDSAGKWLATNDDAVGADSIVQFTPPSDGEYELRVQDHLGRGGDAFVYRIEIDSPSPSLGLSLERIDLKRPQHLQAIAVPQGNRSAALIRADRRDIGGVVAVSIANLPGGISTVLEPIAPDVGLTPIVFEATADAPTAGALAEVNGRIAGANGAADVVGAFRQTMPLVIAPPNETVYYQTSVERLAVAVTEPAPFKVNLAQPATELVQGGTKSLRVSIERLPGFAGEIVLQMLWNPPGIASAVTVTIPGDKSETDYPISAAPDAPVRHSKLAILARSPANGGDVWVSSGLVDLSVESPFFDGGLQLAATECGKPVGLLCKLAPRRAFEGKARLTLVGLPHNTACEPVEVSATDTEVVFNVETRSDAPVGQHGNLFCELSVLRAGETVSHRLAQGGVLRIDAPPVVAAAPVAAPPPPPTPAAEKPAAPPRPLSRLEQLRKEAAERQSTKEASR